MALPSSFFIPAPADAVRRGNSRTPRGRLGSAACGGWGEDVSDPEIVDAIKLLAETEGIFTETAGGVVLGVTKKFIQQGRIKPDEVTVLCITGNGLKTQEALNGCYARPVLIEPRLSSFEEILSNSLTV